MPRSLDISGSGGSLLPGLRTLCSSKFRKRSTTNWVTSVLFRGLRAAVSVLSRVSVIDGVCRPLWRIPPLSSRTLTD